MEKNIGKKYGSKLTSKEKQNIMKQIEKLREDEKYKDIFEEVIEKYKLPQGLEGLEGTNMSEFMAQIDEENYDNYNYRSNEDLQRILTLVDKKQNLAIMINISPDEQSEKNNKIPEGEFGVYDLENNAFKLTNEELKKKIRENIPHKFKEMITSKEEDEILNKIFSKNLDEMEKLVTKGDVQIQNMVQEEVSKVIDEKNGKNGYSKEQRNMIENNEKDEKDEKTKEEQIKMIGKLPPEIAEVCLRDGIIPKAVLTVKGADAHHKISNKFNEYGGDAVIIQYDDYPNPSDRYTAYQDNQQKISGDKNDEIEKVLGKTMQYAKDGQLAEKLEIDDDVQFFEYTDSQGVVVKEKLEEDTHLSVEELEDYKKEVQDDLEKYSKEMNRITENQNMSNEEKINSYMNANREFNNNNEELGRKYGINKNDINGINLDTDKKTEEKIEENQKEMNDSQERDDDDDEWRAHMERVNRNRK